MAHVAEAERYVCPSDRRFWPRVGAVENPSLRWIRARRKGAKEEEAVVKSADSAGHWPKVVSEVGHQAYDAASIDLSLIQDGRACGVNKADAGAYKRNP
jgi:hypothetical protein